MGQAISADWITESKHHHRAEATAPGGPLSANPGHAIFTGVAFTTASNGVMLQPNLFWSGTSSPWQSGKLAPKEPLCRALHETLWSARELFKKMLCGNPLRLWRSVFPRDRTVAGTKRLQPKVKRIPLDDYQTGSVPVAGRRTLDSMLDAHACLDPEPVHASWIPCVAGFPDKNFGPRALFVSEERL